MHFLQQVASMIPALLDGHGGLFLPRVRALLPLVEDLDFALVAELGLVRRELRLTYHGVDAFQTAGKLDCFLRVLLDLGRLLASVGFASAF